MKIINMNALNAPSKKSLQKKATKSLLKGDFKSSFDLFQRAFWLDTNDLDSIIGLYISDMGMDFGNEAMGIYEFYQSLLSYEPRSHKHKIQNMILSLIEAFDNKTHHLSHVVQSNKEAVIESYNAINYADIKELLKTNSFKDVYSRLPLRTKLVFGKKKDFYDFLCLLANNGYIDMFLNYIDSLPHYDSDIVPIMEMVADKLKDGK